MSDTVIEKQMMAGHGYGWDGGFGGGGFMGGVVGGALGGLISRLFGHGGGWGGDGWGRGRRDTDDIFLMKEMADTRRDIPHQTIELMERDFGLQKDILENRFHTAKEICECKHGHERGGFELQKEILNNRFLTEKEICATNAHIDRCCCELKTEALKDGFGQRIEMERGFREAEFRDMKEHCHIEKQLDELRCGQKEIIGFIANQAKDTKIELLECKLAEARERNERLFDKELSEKTNCLVKELGNAQREFLGPTYNWVIPKCGC